MVRLLTAAMLCGVTVSAIAAELKSGLEKGASVPAFYVKDVTGPAKDGEELCYRCRFGNRPTVTVFAKEMTDEVAKLSKAVDGVVESNQDAKMAAFVVVMSDKPASVSGKLTECAATHGLKNVPLTTFKGVAGPQGYNINTAADVTVMMWVEGKVAASHAFKKGELTPTVMEKVVADTKLILN